MPLTVSLNGVDNVGKTTQVGLFPHHYSILSAGSLHDWDKRIGDMVKSDGLQDWWWDSSDENFVCTIFGAVGRRYWGSLADQHIDLVVYDRGATMFQAVAVAVLAVKHPDHDLNQARMKLDEILQRNQLQVPKEQLTILLKHGRDLEDSVKITLERESRGVDERYRLYQTPLQIELRHQEDDGFYQHTIEADGPDSYRHIQNRIGEIVRSQTNDTPFAPMLHNLQRVYAFGGFSEAGKSSLAQSLCNHYGPKWAFRGKIVFFNDIANNKMKKSIYSLTEKEQAMCLFHEFEKFSYRHCWLRVTSIESLHRDTMTMWLKTWLGDKMQIIYVDTALEERIKRSCDPYQDVVAKDRMKQERGTHRIRQRADLVLSNNGTFEESVKQMMRNVCTLDPIA